MIVQLSVAVQIHLIEHVAVVRYLSLLLCLRICHLQPGIYVPLERPSADSTILFSFCLASRFRTLHSMQLEQ